MDRTIVLDETGQKVMDGETDVIFETKIEELIELGIPIPRVISLQEHVSIPFTLCKEKLFHEPVPSLPEPRPAALSAEDALSVHELSFSRGADVIFQDVSFSVKKVQSPRLPALTEQENPRSCLPRPSSSVRWAETSK